MRIRNELETAVIARQDDRTIEGITRIRSVDARVTRRGFVMEQREPVAVVVRDAAGVRRATLRERESAPLAAAMIAAPALYLIIRAMVKGGGRR